MVEIVLLRPPSVNRLWRIGNGRMFRSSEYMDWIKQCMIMVREAGVPAIKGKYKIMLRVARPDKRRRDIDNFAKAVQDFLQRAGIIEDDCLCEAIYCKWVSEGPPIRINIYPVRGSNELPREPKRALQSRSQADVAECNKPTETPAAAYARLYKKTRGRIGSRKRGK